MISFTIKIYKYKLFSLWIIKNRKPENKYLHQPNIYSAWSSIGKSLI